MTSRDAHLDADAPASSDAPSGDAAAPDTDALPATVATAETALAVTIAAGMRADGAEETGPQDAGPQEPTGDRADADGADADSDGDGEAPVEDAADPEHEEATEDADASASAAETDAEDETGDGAGPEPAAVASPDATIEADATQTSPADAADTPIDSAAPVSDPDSALSILTDDGTDSPSPAPEARWADDTSHATALAWVDPATVVATPAAQPEEDRTSVFAGARLRRAGTRPGVLVPLGILAALVGTYAGATLLWPLHEIAPTVDAAEIQAAAPPFTTPTWPAQGSAAIGVEGVGTVSSTSDAAGIASVTKVVTTLMVLEKLPLAVGEQGPEYAFTKQDSLDFWTYRRQNQSSLDVPVGGVLTEYQMLQGTLLGSANNYIDRLAREIWGSDRAFAEAAQTWLREHGLDGITIVTPSGFDERNRATPEALVRLSELAMKNPVFAEIVGTKSVELPGAGLVKNTNGMLKDDGVVGIKTGTLEYWNILTAKDVEVGDTTVRLYAAVLGQDSNDDRLAATRSLFAETEKALDDQPTTVPAGTVVGEVRTVWGAKADVVTDADADVVLWNSAVPQTSTAFDLGDRSEDGARVGTLTTTGPLNSVETPLVLADDLDGPSPWWRLTHPLELFGITEAKR